MSVAARGARLLVGLVATCSLLAGCLSVPHSGRVQGVDGKTPSPPVRNVLLDPRIEAAPPGLGEEPKAIVRDFYEAMVDYNLGYDVAKQYLVNPSGPWSGGAPATTDIVTALAQPVLAAPATATSATFLMHFIKVGEVNADHELVAVPTPGAAILSDLLTVVLDPVTNQWRIAAGAPAAMRLTVADFKTLYHEATLYFPRHGHDGQLIADPRWFEARRAELPGAIAEAYLGGPKSFLAASSGVDPLFPPGSSRVEVAQASPGEASLAFSVPPAGLTDGLVRSAMEALQRTFRQPQPSFTDVSKLSVTINGVKGQPLVTTPPVGATLRTVANAWFIDGKSVLRPWLESAAAPTSSDIAPVFIVKDMDNVSLSPDTMYAAGDVMRTDGSRGLRVVSQAMGTHDVPLQVADVSASAVTSLTWNVDGSGFWVAGLVGGLATVWFVKLSAVGEGASSYYSVVPTKVTVDRELTRDDRTLIDLRPSPDGVRISAVAVEKGGKQGVLYVGRIDATHAAPAVVGFRRIAPVLAPASPATKAFTVGRAVWKDAETLTLIALGGDGYTLWTASVDGSEVSAQSPAGGPALAPETVLASAQGADLLAFDPAKKGRLFELTETGWEPVKARPDMAPFTNGVLYPG